MGELMIKTTCPYCGVGCGVKASPTEAVKGDQQHPANFGRLCVKGSSLHETLGEKARLLQPFVHGEAQSWSQALDVVAKRFSDIVREHGPDAVAFYVSGQLLTEDYYVANKLMKGYIGSANIDTNSRLCMSSAVAAHKRAFGEDVVPGCYEDLELADLVILTGSNTAWAHPVIYQRIVAAKQRRPDMRVVVIDPRRTATCDVADLHLPLAPGADAYLFAGLLVWLAEQSYVDEDYIRAHTNGFNEALLNARQSCPDMATTATLCGLPVNDVKTFFRLFARTSKVVTLFSQGINQSDSGTDKGNAIINVHLATGRIGLPGASPFSMTGQPNAMGGREVGGLANQLAAHLDIENPLHRGQVQDFWHSPTICRENGLKAVEMFDAVADGKIKAIWIMATNPVVSMPNADKVKKALEQCEFVVVSDCVASTDTTLCADVLLPAVAWGEKSGTVTNSERCISRQRAFLPEPGEAKPDWWIVSQVGQRMGFAEAFSYESAAEVFREHAALTGAGAQHGKALDISAMATLSDHDYDVLEPTQWPVNSKNPKGKKRIFENGGFSTADGRANFIPVRPSAPIALKDITRPFCLNTGRIRDQWHTMTRTGRAAKLFRHIAEPFAEMHPDDAQEIGARAGELVEVESDFGKALVRLTTSQAQQHGSVFMPIHWNDQFSSCARVDALVAPITDPHSGQPAFKQTAVTVRPWAHRWDGWVLASAPVTLPVEYWSRMTLSHQVDGWRLAGQRSLTVEQLRESIDFPVYEWVEMSDEDAGHFRLLAMDKNRLPLLWAAWSEEGARADTDWLANQFNIAVNGLQAAALLAGAPAQAGPDLGAVICSCFQVREATINEAIAKGADTAEEIGRVCRAGTNCGSCLPEIRGLLAVQA